MLKIKNFNKINLKEGDGAQTLSLSVPRLN